MMMMMMMIIIIINDNNSNDGESTMSFYNEHHNWIENERNSVVMVEFLILLLESLAQINIQPTLLFVVLPIKFI